MCNPDDETPCVDGEPAADIISADLRSTGQRNHDALKALCRAILASGQPGRHKGLPVTMVISTTLKELESGTGHAVTGGGTLLPMSEVIRQASAAHHYLTVFDDHTEEPLYLGRSKRLASTGQRLVLYARDRGCTFPGCTAPAYHSEVHHRRRDWAAGGLTNIDDETLACGKDNRRVKPGGWSTRTRKDGRTEWIPPPQPRHRPSAGEQLPPPRALPHPRRTRHRRRRRRESRLLISGSRISTKPGSPLDL
jgi:Domain of unknown function (DUF222)